MRILIGSHLFTPSVGGIETMSLLLAKAFVARGHEVRVTTLTPSEHKNDDHGLIVVRCPNRKELQAQVSWSEICFHNNISLSQAGPILRSLRPWVITTQTWIARQDKTLGWREHLKRLLLRRAHSVAISRAVADSLPVKSTIIPNCYDDSVFHENGSEGREDKRELIFAGRLVSDKGVDLALDALALLAKQGLRPQLTITGDGPEKSRLETAVDRLGLQSQVTFTGALKGQALAQEFRKHRIQLVPSRWAEPFGIVALEGAACGCFVLGSQEGGLADAIGPCGATFPNGDTNALAELISQSIQNKLTIPSKTVVEAHLRKHHLETVTDAYLSLFHRLVRTTG